MPKYLVRYTHVEEYTYEDYIEADSEEAAYAQVGEDPLFEDLVNVQGIEIKDINIIDTVEED